MAAGSPTDRLRDFRPTAGIRSTFSARSVTASRIDEIDRIVTGVEIQVAFAQRARVVDRVGLGPAAGVGVVVALAEVVLGGAGGGLQATGIAEVLGQLTGAAGGL